MIAERLAARVAASIKRMSPEAKLVLRRALEKAFPKRWLN